MSTPSTQQKELLGLLTRVFGISGLITSLAVVLAYPFSKVFRESVIARLCVAISLADFLSVGAQLLGRLFLENGGETSVGCQLQATLQQFGEVAAALIIPCIALNLLLVVRSRATLDQIISYDYFYIPIVYSIAGIIAAVPLWLMDVNGKPAYGDSGTWCYLTRNAKLLMWTLYGPIIFTFFFNIGTYIAVKVAERAKMRENALFRGFSVDDPRLDLLPGIISIYIVVFSVTWLPMMTVFLYKQFDPLANVYWLSVLNAIFLPARGLSGGVVAFYQAWRSKNPVMNTLGGSHHLKSF